MGSFNLACAVSGLPCTPGDPVYTLILTHNHEYGESRDVYSNALWTPRSPALRGTYYDYGRVKLSTKPEEKVLQAVTRQLLDVESVEGGGSRNTPIRHGMDLADYLEAINEDGVVVSCESWRAIREMNDRSLESLVAHGIVEPEPAKPTVGPIPTVGSVVAVLEQGGLKANDPNAPHFHVHEYEKGEIVVTCEPWGSLTIEEAKAAMDLDETYVSVTTRSRGHDEMRCALRVFPQPKAKGWVGPDHFLDDPPRRLTSAVIRADVWHALLGMNIPTWRTEEKDGIALSNYMNDEKAIRKIWFKHREWAEGSVDDAAALQRALKRSHITTFLWGGYEKGSRPSTLAGHLGQGSCSGGSGSPGITGWADHYERWLDALAQDPDVAATADLVGQRFAQCGMIYDHLSLRNLRIMPSQYAGQEKFWPQHAMLHDEIRHIAAKAQLAHDADYGDKSTAEIRATGFRLVRARQAKVTW
jgi:hypothetical protein